MFRNLWCIGLLAVACASAADQTWTGQISDSMCGASHAQMIARKNKELQTNSAAPETDCTLACVKEGAKYVFVVKGKVYKIANQTLAALQVHAGHTVLLTGDLAGDSITVSKIVMPAKK
jgi:hypothetical protein